jgi:hypothetical protein
VSRKTDLTSGSFTNPPIGRWKISIVWETFQYYMWPQELQNVMYLDFAPRMTELMNNRYQPVEDFGSQALFALVNMKERTGPCSCAPVPPWTLPRYTDPQVFCNVILCMCSE